MINSNISLADKNWFRTGGAAKFYTEPANADEFIRALEFKQANNLPLFVLGGGANILISDDGFDGLVIKPSIKNVSHSVLDDEYVEITAGSGISIHDLIEYCLSNNLIGLEEFSGIPGTVGGAVYINLHYFEHLLSHFLIRAEVIDQNTGIIKTVDNAWFQFGYNSSTLINSSYYLITATFKVKKTSDQTCSFARGRRSEIIRHRNKRYPTSGTCGSFFRNFYEEEVHLISQGKKVIWVAYYLDKVGVKGALRHGSAVVSHQHANMIVNEGNATSHDIINLARKMQEIVHESFKILPQPECRLIGFKEYPLLRMNI